MNDAPLLSVRALSVRRAGRDSRTIVDSLSFDVGAERMALVGESGSGKSVTARALLGLLRKPLQATAERLTFAGRDLRNLTPAQWSQLRGADLALVLQDPRHALNPVLRVGRQLDEMLRIHQRLTAAERLGRIAAMLQAVGLEPGRVLGLHAHELSGGMGQRVMLAMMLINGPRLLIADEPTSALDAELRDQVLALISNLVASRRMGLLLISHDLQQVARHCDRVLVMYRGRIVDAGAAGELADSRHPYTRMLWSCKPGVASYGTELPVSRDWQSAGTDIDTDTDTDTYTDTDT
jgi:peptide/nickel transport system ATP-binding protein